MALTAWLHSSYSVLFAVGSPGLISLTSRVKDYKYSSCRFRCLALRKSDSENDIKLAQSCKFIRWLGDAVKRNACW